MPELNYPEAYINKDAKAEELLHHLKVRKEDIGSYVLFPEDPQLCLKISKFLEQVELKGDFREYVTYTGIYEGVRVSIVSSGLGGPSGAIAVEELVKSGVHTCIRIGTAGSIQEDMKLGDVFIATSAIRDEGTTYEYVPEEIPAVADLYVTQALRQGAANLKVPVKTGMVHSKNSLITDREPWRTPMKQSKDVFWNILTDVGIQCSDMSSAAVFIVGAVRSIRTGSILTVVSQLPDLRKGMKNQDNFNEEKAIEIALEGLKVLINEDIKRGVNHE